MLWHSLPIRSPTNSFLLFNYSEHKPQKQLQSVRKTKENKTKAPSLSRSPFCHSEQQSSSISMPIHERQTPNSKHYHYWSPLRPYSHHRALSLTQASLLGHIVKGHHQHNRHAVATKTDVKLKKREEKKRNQTKTKLWEGNELISLWRTPRPDRIRLWGTWREGTVPWLSTQLKRLNEWIHEWRTPAKQLQYAAHELNWIFLSLGQHQSRGSTIRSPFYVCVCHCVCANNYYHLLCTHTHTYIRIVIGCRGPSDTHKRGKNEEEEKKWVRKPMEQPAPST